MSSSGKSTAILCTILALGQMLLFTAPVMAQQANYWGDGRIFPYNRGYASPIGPWSHTTGPQFGYRAQNRVRRGTGGGTAIGLCMLGGIVGLGALSMGSQMLSRRGASKKHNNPNPPKDRIASKDRRQKQELKIKGELDQDYQKEMAEKGLAMAPPSGNPMGMGGSPGAMGMQGMPGMQGLTAPSQSSAQFPGMAQSAPPQFAPAQSMAPAQNMAPAFNSNGGNQLAPAFQGKENVEGDILNPTPWTPSSDGPNQQF